MFTEIDRIGICKNSDFIETDDLLEFKIISCLNVDICMTLGCPGIGSLGCVHSLAGCLLIENAVQNEFRRLKTLYNDDECCHF